MVVFSCFNLYTLYVAYVYSSYIKSNFDENVCVIWRNNVANIDIDALRKFFDTVIFLDSKKDFQENIKIKRDLLVKSLEDNVILKNTKYLFVFKDNNIYDATIIDYTKNSLVKNSIIIMIEEGTALYYKQHTRLIFLKKLLIKLIGLPQGTIYRYQGENPLVDIVISENPHNLPKRIGTKKIVLKQSYIFHQKHILSFTKKLFNFSLEDIKYDGSGNFDILFFSQPLSEDGYVNYENELKVFKSVLKSIPLTMNLYIKLHPRESEKKYSSIIDKKGNCFLLEKKFQVIPGDFLPTLLRPKIIITPFSSAVLKKNSVSPSIKKYAIFQLYNLSNKQKRNISHIFEDSNVKIISDIQNIFTEELDDNVQNIVQTRDFKEMSIIFNKDFNKK